MFTLVVLTHPGSGRPDTWHVVPEHEAPSDGGGHQYHGFSTEADAMNYAGDIIGIDHGGLTQWVGLTAPSLNDINRAWNNAGRFVSYNGRAKLCRIDNTLYQFLRGTNGLWEAWDFDKPHSKVFANWSLYELIQDIEYGR